MKVTPLLPKDFSANGVRYAFAAMLAVVSVGCGCPTAHQSANSPGENRIYVARPCENLRDGASDRAPAAILVEIADTRTATGSPLPEWLSMNAVDAHNVAQVVVSNEPGKETSVSWGLCVTPNCAQWRDGRLVIRPRVFPEGPSAPVELELEVRMGETSVGKSTVVRAKDQEPVLAQLTDRGTAVLTPYYLPEPLKESELRLLRCKAR